MARHKTRPSLVKEHLVYCFGYFLPKSLSSHLADELTIENNIKIIYLISRNWRVLDAIHIDIQTYQFYISHMQIISGELGLVITNIGITVILYQLNKWCISRLAKLCKTNRILVYPRRGKHDGENNKKSQVENISNT